MTTTSVGVPFPVYTDTSGDPVDAGYLYLGVAGVNPEVNPIQAYWDTDLTIPAAQPIRTSGGYPMRGGSPGRLFVAVANYSITLKDRASRLVWSSLNGEGLGVDLQIQLAFSTTLFTAVGGETVLSTGQPYTSEMLYVDQNGLGLYSGVHFTETTSTTITLASAAVAGDVFRIRVGQFLGASAEIEDRLAALEAQTSMAAHEAAADPHPGYVTTAEGAALITAHEVAADPHPGYTTAAELAVALTTAAYLPYTATSKSFLLSPESSVSTTEQVYTKVLEYRVPVGGFILSRMTLSSASPAYTSNGRIYINGVASGTERGTATSAVFEEAITVAAGDLLQLYLKSQVGSGGSLTSALLSLWSGETTKTIPIGSNTVGVS